MRVAALRGSPLFVACCNSLTCCCTSGGHADDRAAIFATDDLSVSTSPRLAAIRLRSIKVREIVRLHGKNLLNQTLKFLFVSFALDFLRKFINREQVFGYNSTALRSAVIASPVFPRLLSSSPTR